MSYAFYSVSCVRSYVCIMSSNIVATAGLYTKHSIERQKKSRSAHRNTPLPRFCAGPVNTAILPLDIVVKVSDLLGNISVFFRRQIQCDMIKRRPPNFKLIIEVLSNPFGFVVKFHILKGFENGRLFLSRSSVSTIGLIK